MLKKNMLIAGMSYLLVQRRVKNSPEPPTSMILRGEYENKIRRFSPPEKIFMVFGSIYEKGKVFMTMKDLLKAICFYNYSMCDQSDTIGFRPKNVLKFFGQREKFEIYDYFILVRFLAFQRAKIQDYMTKNGLSSMDKMQFLKFIEKVCGDYEDFIKPSILVQSRQFSPKKEDFLNRLKIVTENLYEQKEAYTYQEIINFRRSIICDLYQFQFLMFPIKKGHIDGVDFARSIIKYVEPSKTRKFMKRIRNIQDSIREVQIDKEAYLGFHLYMQTNITELETVLNTKGAIEAKHFSELINRYVKSEYHVTPKEIEVIVKLLDYDDSGFLQKKEILGVLKNLQYYTTIKSGQTTFVESMKQDWHKIVEKSKRIMEILQQ